MVATKVSEVAAKGWGWFEKETDTASPSSPSARAPPPPLASSSLQKAARSAYSGIANVYSSLSVPALTPSGRSNSNDINHSPTSLDPTNSEEDGHSASFATSVSGLSKGSNSHGNGRKRFRKSVLSTQIMLKMMDNPYIGVRGGGRRHSVKPQLESINAVRNLISVVDDEEDQNNQVQNGNQNIAIRPAPLTPSRAPLSNAKTTPEITATPRHRNNAVDNMTWNDTAFQQEESQVKSFLPRKLATIESMSVHSSPAGNDKNTEADHDQNRNQIQTPTSIYNSTFDDTKPSSSSHSPEETASQLTEGTLRALRDLALDEALGLHASLKYWSDRWERPFFSWFVAGPLVWFGWIQNTQHLSHQTTRDISFGGGYDHSMMVGQRVSQIQAVLARRLTAIGELQHHLLRAGWQRGVAQWGFLGDGGNWAAVDGADGRIIDDNSDHYSHHSFHDDDEDSDHHDFEDDLYGNEPSDGLQHHNSGNFFPETPHDHIATSNKNFVSTMKSPDQYQTQHRNHRYRLLRRDFSEASVANLDMHIDVPPPPPGISSPRKSTSSRLSQHEERRRQGGLYYTNIRVRKRNGGHIQKDDTSLAEWSIDALALIRSQLIRAANGKIPVPYSENWPFEHSAGTSSVLVEALNKSNQDWMPVWAGMKRISSSSNSYKAPRSRMESKGSCFSITEHNVGHNHNNGNTNEITKGSGCIDDAEFPHIGSDCFEQQSLGEAEIPATETRSKEQQQEQQQHQPPLTRRSPSQRSISSKKERSVVGVTNLPLMTNEVSGLLDVMEDIMDVQRVRRLEKLKPPPWWRQNWFLIAMVPPTVGYLLYNNLIGRGQSLQVVKYVAIKILDFAREHVVLPCVALYDEFTKGPESISDHMARDTACETLKKMIRSWLDETYPEMQEAEKMRLSDAMDISLVEDSKEQSMKSVYNMNSVIRMSFIEAQFIKKEMMNALVALDEMQASTNFNMNLAAITPFVLLMWSIKQIGGFVFYTTFKWGKSRKETYRSFFDALTEIERLLIMRSNPPSPPTTLRYDHSRAYSPHSTQASANCVLGSDDLGMLMLHIHQLRTLLWQERRRFTPTALRSLSEDLSELSGERGAVSVMQQLLIVERMSRAYSFLKRGAID